MRKHVWAAGLLIGIVTVAAAKDKLLECGSYFTKAQEERFLHARHTARRSAARSADAVASRTAMANRDVGDIAVIGAGNGVVGTRNPLDLASKTLTYTPAPGGGFQLAADVESYDAAAALSGTRLDLDDDDSAAVALPFPFQFYGGVYNSAFVNSNGTVTFGKGRCRL
ncbi:MAG: hypothetical protein WDO18_08545 [Acidobacteriota bacterium]